MSSLKEKLRDLLDKLEGWREVLKDHEPSHVLPSDVEKQLQSLSVSGYCVGIVIRGLWVLYWVIIPMLY